MHRKNSNNYKLIVLFSAILFILLIALLVVVKSIKRESINVADSNSVEIVNTIETNDNIIPENVFTNKTEEKNEEVADDPRENFGVLDILNSRNEYLSAKQCIADFNYVLKMLFYKKYNQLEPGDNQDYAQSTINLLDKSQIDLLGINKDNIYNYAGKYNFVAQSGYRLTGDFNSASIILFGYRVDLSSNNIEDYGYVVRYDSSSNTYSVFTYEYLAQKGFTNLNKGNKIELYDSELTNNGNNIFKFINANPYDIAQDYLNTFKLNSIYRPEMAYNELNESYASKFGSAEAFKEYINNNQSSLNSIILSGCDKVSSGSNVKFVCQDSNKNTFNIIAKPYEDIFDFKIEFSNIIL